MRTDGEGYGPDHAFSHVFPLSHCTLVLQLQERSSQNCAKLLSQAIAVGPQRGWTPRFSQRTKPCGWHVSELLLLSSCRTGNATTETSEPPALVDASSPQSSSPPGSKQLLVAPPHHKVDYHSNNQSNFCMQLSEEISCSCQLCILFPVLPQKTGRIETR